MCKLLALNRFADNQKNPTDTLCASGSFGVAIFDNSQNIQSLKFQQFGRSSAVTLTTSQFFLMLMNPVFPSTTIFHNNHVDIIYHNQSSLLPTKFLPLRVSQQFLLVFLRETVSQRMILPLTCHVIVWRIMQTQ